MHRDPSPSRTRYTPPGRPSSERRNTKLQFWFPHDFNIFQARRQAASEAAKTPAGVRELLIVG